MRLSWKPSRKPTGKSSTEAENAPEGWIAQSNWNFNEDGSFSLVPNTKGDSKSFKDALWTENTHDDFELSIDYKYQPGNKASLVFRVSDKEKPEKYYKILIGDSEEQGGLSWIVKPAKKASNGPEQWNNLFVSAKGENIRVELNGEKVVDETFDLIREDQ